MASIVVVVDSLLAAGVLGDGLGALGDGVLGELARQQQTHGRLDFAARDRVLLVVVGQTRRLGGDALEQVVHERVHDRHGFRADARVRVHLFEHLVDVGRVRLLGLLPALLVTRASSFLRLGSLFGSFGAWFRRHVRERDASETMSRNNTNGYQTGRAACYIYSGGVLRACASLR